jgi:hypothetical protein
MLPADGTEPLIEWRRKEMSHVTVRTADVALGVECALPAGFEAYDAGGATVRPSATARWQWPRLALRAFLLFCLAAGVWQFGT